MCIQELIEKIRCSPRGVDFPPLVAFFVVLLGELFFGLPSARLALGQLLSVSAGGFGDSEERRVCWKKRGRGPAGALQTHQYLSSTPTVLQHSKEKGFPYSLSCSFCSACGGRNVGGKWALFIMHWSACRLSILF